MQIPLMIEPAFGRASVWCDQLRRGALAEASRKKYKVLLLDSERCMDASALFGSGKRLLALAGTSPSWIPGIIDRLAGQGIQVLLVSYQPPENLALAGLVHMDYTSGIRLMLDSLRACGRKATALYGCNPNSSNDQVKREAFSRYLRCEGQAVEAFDNDSGLSQCYAAFRGRAGAFDSVLCVNDIAAASLIVRLSGDGVPVPDRLYVTAFGNTEIARLFCPSITTATLDHLAVGRQLVSLYAYLYRSEMDVSVTVRVPCKLEARESTESRIPPDAVGRTFPSARAQAAGRDFYDDPEVRAFTALEGLLLQCDASDWSILAGLLGGQTYEFLAERLEMPIATLRYRIRRLAGCVGADSRNGLVSFVAQNHFFLLFQKSML